MTDKTTALRLAVYYRGLATASFLVGGSIAAAGLWLGLREAALVFLRSFLQEDVVARTLAAADLPVTVAGVVVGVTVWQVGKSAAFYWTFSEAVEDGSPGGPATGTEGETLEDGSPGGTAGAETERDAAVSGTVGEDP